MIERKIGLVLGFALLAACGGAEPRVEASETPAAPEIETIVEAPVNVGAVASEAEVAEIAKAIAEYAALQEHCEYGSSNGQPMAFISEFMQTPTGEAHSYIAIVTANESAGLFADAEPEGVCTPEMYEQFKGPADDAIAAWEKIKNGN